MNEHKTNQEFDLADFIAWILENNHQIKRRTEWLEGRTAIECPKIINGDLFYLADKEIANAIARFPKKARDRSLLAHINGMPPAWIKKGSTPAKQVLCHSQKYAASPLSIVAALADDTRKFGHRRTQDILLFEMRYISPEVAKYVQLHALMREYAHTLISPLEEDTHEEYVLNFSQSYHVEAHIYLAEFARCASNHSPISRASEPFWPLPSVDDRNFCRFVGKELCESIAAYLLGFVYCAEDERRWDPFRDRKEVREMIEHFLEASTVPALVR